jgi:acid phosphatase type 7
MRRLCGRLAGLAAVAALCCALSAPASQADPVIAASGDIACGSNSGGASCHQGQTANVLLAMPQLDAVLPLGDNQYECGELSNFNNFYNPTWGQLKIKTKTHPAVGNHEYRVSDPSNECLPQGPGAPGYYTYFGSSASPQDNNCTQSCKGYYSYNLGTWHLIALNSNCSQVGGCSAGSPQNNWLKGDLATAKTKQNCILAYFHHPRYSSGGRQTSGVQGLWEALYDAGADVALTGHDHTYERFGKLGRGSSAAVDPVPDAKGIREWIVGLGGRNITSWSTIRAESQVRDRSAFGVLRLTLHSNGYDWKFLSEAGKTFTDASTTATPCNGAPVGGSTGSPPSVPTGLTTTPVSATEIDLSWNASTDPDGTGVAGYHVFRNGTLIATVTGATTYKDTALSPGTQYSYAVSAFDAANDESTQSAAMVAATPTAGGGGGGGTPLFGDDFESGTLSKWSGASGLAVQSSVVASGTFAARATATGSPAFAFQTLASGSSQLYYRLRFNVQSQAATSAYLARLRTASNGAILGLYIGSTGILCYRDDITLANTCTSVSPPKGVWHTALLHVIVNGAASTVEVSLDGTQLIGKTDNLGTTGVGRIELGDSSGGKTFDVAFDDVVVDTNALTPTAAAMSEVASPADIAAGGIAPASMGMPILSP